MSRRWRAQVLALVPGLGHLHLGRHWRGLMVFGLFALACNGMYYGYMYELATEGRDETGRQSFLLCGGGAAAMWLYSLLHVAYLSKRFERRASAERRDYHFKRGLTQYVAGALDGAETEFLAVLKLDPLDVDARFHLAMTLKARGQGQKAIKAFKRCLADDVDGKWKWEIETQLEELKRTG